MSHFVKKVPTTEEERKAIEEEKAKKLKILQTLTERINAKISAREFDETFMRDTYLVLSKNANILTLWNIRRDAVEAAIARIKADQPEGAEETIKQLCEAEMGLAQEALQNDSKSYGAWFHRFWAYERHSGRNAEAEINNCGKALSMDTRNFHAWDHLRSVTKLESIGAERAVQFSDERLQQDITNYSAYHYRSKALPSVKPDPEELMQISSEALMEEIKLIEGAVFTEPKDQSPWVYAIWLLDQATKGFPSSLKRDEPVLLSATTKSVAFSYPVKRTDIQKYIKIGQNATFEPATATMLGNPKYQMARNWFVQGVDGFEVTKAGQTVDQMTRYVDRETIRECLAENTIKSKSGEAVFREFSDQVEELIEAEPEVFWPIYFQTLCLLKLGESMSSYDKLMANYAKMVELDPKRKNVYKSKASALSIRKALFVDKHKVDEEKTQFEAILDGRSELSLRNYGITDISLLGPLGGLITDIDLQYGGIENLCQFQMIPALECLNLDDNPITRITPNIRLPNLTFLSLARTQIQTVEDIKAISAFTSLEKILVCETALVTDAAEEFQRFVDGLRTPEEASIRVFIYYL
ncbi:hypothetical protein L596_009978 [Steinernema carpocapsae]|uniref:Geranylgeranyl transferase type-2 subunit alpha n=1 Tax=Steinernema carpocapsae TaxID=34508 RepID=A0A4U5PHF4_STECR|nr:hypothetical protein L596_009978 [Steinernema carpocapsae]